MMVGSAKGRLESTGTTGTWALEKGDCFGGDRDGYFGAQVEQGKGSGVVVKFVKDPIKGWAVLVNEADSCKQGDKECKAIIFTAEDCKTFDIGIAVDPNMKSKYFGGDVSLDCSADDAHVFGKLTLKACRNAP
jgi:hypothetical protein